MREIGAQEVRDIAYGSAILGTGGGGNPHLGSLATLRALEQNGPIPLVELDELERDDLIAFAMLVGSPVAGSEKMNRPGFPRGSVV